MFLGRIGKTAVKFIYEIEGTVRICSCSCIGVVIGICCFTVQRLQLPAVRGINEGDLIHVSFDRGSKSVRTAEQPLKAEEEDDESFFIEFKQMISLKVTLYRDSKDNFQVRCDAAL
jgi:hypothetical protein